MTKYVVKRVLLAILTVFIVCAITFFAMNAIPGGPFDGEKAISDEVRRVLEQRFNLDKPVWEQFFLYLNNLLHGDFGVSAKTGREIKTTIFNSFGVSAKLGGMAVLVALISGVVLGSIAALTRNRLPDRLIIFFSTLFTSLPSFVLGTLLLLVFCIRLKWIPVWSSSSQNYVLPVIALAAYPMAYITRLTKTSMLDALGQDYVRTARAKGVAQWKVIFKHTLRNALIPVITTVGIQFGNLLGGAVLTESIFAIPGLGKMMVDAIKARNYPVVQGGVLVVALTFSLVNLAVDILYAYVDPRIRSQYK